VRIRALAKAAPIVALIVVVLIGWRWYTFFGHRTVTAQARPSDFRNIAHALQSTNDRQSALVFTGDFLMP
jgi:hypothetical protein